MTQRIPPPFFLVLACVLSLSASWPPPVHALWGDSARGFGLDGSLRNLSALVENYRFPPLFGEPPASDAYSQTLLRLTAQGRPSGALAFEFHLVQDLAYRSSASAGASLTGQSPGMARYRAWDSTLDYWSDSSNSSSLWTDRANATLSLDWADITVGRQAITFGKAYFWNPLDVFLPFDPRQFDRDYKPGVDALRIDIPLGSFSGLTLVGAAGRWVDPHLSARDNDASLDADWEGSSILARYFTNKSEWDLAVQCGKIYGGWHAGAGLTGEVGPLEVRAEAAGFAAHDSPALPGWDTGYAPVPGFRATSPPEPREDLFVDGVTAVVGLGRRFENSLTLEAEYLYNSAGAHRDASQMNTSWLRWANQGLIQAGRHLAAGSLTYDFSPLSLARIGGIYSFSDFSFQLQPSMTTSLSDNLEFIVGGVLCFGDRPAAFGSVDFFQRTFSMDIQPGSEFGMQPHTFYLEGKYYF